jgi:hypothetical protein
MHVEDEKHFVRFAEAPVSEANISASTTAWRGLVAMLGR